MTSLVHIKYQNYYISASLATTNVGIGITEGYLRKFVYPSMYHLLQILGSHNSEIERHISLFSSLHKLVALLRNVASVFEGENRLAIVEPQDITQNLHRCLKLLEYRAASFTR